MTQLKNMAASCTMPTMAHHCFGRLIKPSIQVAANAHPMRHIQRNGQEILGHIINMSMMLLFFFPKASPMLGFSFRFSFGAGERD